MRIAIVTEQEYLEKGWKEDNVLRIKLISLLRNDEVIFAESNVLIIDWRDHQINLHGFDAIFISSSWNAVDFPDEFKRWLLKTESDGVVRLINNKEMMFKSLDKKNYFQELSSILVDQNLRGGLIPTYFTPSINENNQKINLDDIRDFLKSSDYNSKEIVIKPRISADGKDMSRIRLFNKSNKEIQAELDIAFNKNKIRESGGMVQPLIETIESINEYGEYQLLFLNGQFSHATVKPSGFGVLEKKFIKKENLPEHMSEFCQFIANYFFEKYKIIRIRIDMLLDTNKKPVLLEAEFIEPNSNTDCVYKYALAQLDRQNHFLPSNECQEYDRTMNKFALAIYNEAKRLTKNKNKSHHVEKFNN